MFEVAVNWAKVVAIIAIICMGVLYAIDARANTNHRVRVHTCYSPCTVILPPNTMEDEFDFNYTWPTKRRPVIQVWHCNVNRPGACDG